jgi:hypothetical protein
VISGEGRVGQDWVGVTVERCGLRLGNMEWCCEEEIPRTSMDCCT